jgi:hypothetical protein
MSVLCLGLLFPSPTFGDWGKEEMIVATENCKIPGAQNLVGGDRQNNSNIT